MSDEEMEKWAKFRFEVIAELLDEKLDRAQKAIIRKEILARNHERPDGRVYRVSERTLSEWLSRYRSDSLEGLENRTYKNKGQMRSLDPEVLEKAKELRLTLPTRSIEDLRVHLKYSESIDVEKVSASTLNRHLKRVGSFKEKNYEEKGNFQHFQKEHINQLWQSDCSDGIYLPDPTGLKREKQTTLITCIDDASRFCVHGQFYWSEQLIDLLDCLNAAVLARGRPSKLYCDNGSIYRAHDFSRICRELGINLRHAEPYRPEGKGKQERHYLTLQMRFYKEASKAGLMTLRELNEFFWAWLDECYHKQKHSSIGMTPMERWQQEERLIERQDPARLYEAMQLQTRRKIGSRTGIIQLNGKMYQAGAVLAGQVVRVRWPFNDDSHINIFRDGKCVERAAIFVPRNDIDYSKRPDRTKKEEIPKVLDCSKKLKAALLAKFRYEKPPVETSRYGFLTSKEFRFVVKECLGRLLKEPENEVLEKVYPRLSPIDAQFVEMTLRAAIARKGNQMHISFYVQLLEEWKTKQR